MGRRRLAVAALVVAGLGLSGAMVPASAQAALQPGCAQSGTTVTCTYGYTGGEQVFVVPVGVTSVTATAVGASSAAARDPLNARGAQVSGGLSGLSVGQQLFVLVGGDGEAQQGFNGGGRPARAGGFYGGGASDIRSVSTSGANSAASLDSRLIVAAGSGAIPDINGGSAGQPGRSNAGAGGGGAGTSAAGGSGGTGMMVTENGVTYTADSGTPGRLGVGGDGGASNGSSGLDGGAGGGGYFGGGGGGGGTQTPTGGTGGGGGGGGSSLVPAGGSGPTLTQARASVTIVYTAPPTAGAISATSGGGQSAQTGTPFAAPLVATVTDSANPNLAVPGAPVTFSVTSGSASFGGAATATAITDTSGRATSPTLKAGSTAGPVTVTATTPGVATAATFTETVTSPPPPAPTRTRVSGTAQFRSGNDTVTLKIDVSGTASSGSGSCSLTGAGFSATCTSISSVTRGTGSAANSATITGTAQGADKRPVPFKAQVVDGANPNGAGRDRVTLTVGNRSDSGTVTSGNLTIATT